MRDEENAGRETILRIAVQGIPRPKGSVLARRNGTISEPKTLRNWQMAIAKTAERTLGEPPRHSGPVSVWALFSIERSPCEPPDLDKLLRAALDSISGGTDWGFPVIRDDAQVVEIGASKINGGRPGMGLIVGKSVGRSLGTGWIEIQ
jgi:Holliday junction resolvase RusA-like endonuclease